MILTTAVNVNKGDQVIVNNKVFEVDYRDWDPAKQNYTFHLVPPDRVNSPAKGRYVDKVIIKPNDMLERYVELVRNPT